MRVLFLALILPLCLSAVFAQSIILEPIVIERNRYSHSLKDSEYFVYDYENGFPYSSQEDIVDYSSSLDLRKRTAYGLSQDVSLRGSIFEDTAVTLNGIKLNDPQTGHFSLQIPLTSADFERADILKNPQIINFTLKRPKDSGGLVKASFGEHALWEELISCNFRLSDIKNRISLEHKSSKGHRQDTDFDIYNFSSHSFWQKDFRYAEFIFGSTIRDFGLGNGYASRFPSQQEHITQQFYSLIAGIEHESCQLKSSIYLRRHTDKFILERHNPPFYTNYHTTYVYGMNNRLEFSNYTFFSFDIERQKIDSTNLNKHKRLRKGLSLGIDENRIGDFIFDIHAGVDYYEHFEFIEKGHLGFGYFLNDKLKLRFSYDRLWRAPSFTELYYVSPSDRGNPFLGLQRSNNFELGADLSLSPELEFSTSLFLRDQSDTIDWVKNNPALVWKADNVGDIKAYGVDEYLKLKINKGAFDALSFAYTYLELDKDNTYNFSKYVFDYNKHKLVNSYDFSFGSLAFKAVVNFIKPLRRKNYTTLDLKAFKQLGNFSLSLEGTNIFNKGYQESADIPCLGRWYKLSLSYAF
ncbi:MAG: TonB-dependent receptor [Candidatus Omnitrophica bacterium]|nr:TonB-dependent receptor [Candidatus Omnitrophota bacterium]